MMEWNEESAEIFDVKTEEHAPGCSVKARHIMALLSFFTTFNLYSLRSILNVAIVAMVNNTNTDATTNTSNCPDHGMSGSSDVTSNFVFNWNRTQQGLLLGCYYYGYVFSCFPGGYLAQRFGVRLVLGLSMLLASALSIVSPFIAYISFELFVVFRILLGFVQGVTIPALYAMWGKWAPPGERSNLIGITFAGSSFGMFVTFPIAGIIAHNLGWESVYYFTGGFALVFSMLFLLFAHNSPENHPRISPQEKLFITESIRNGKKFDQGRGKTPFRDIFKSPPVWGIFVAQFCSNWGDYTLIAMLPTYMASVLKFSISASGIFSALPYILQFLIIMTSGYITDIILAKKVIKLTAMRKINTTIGLVLPALFIVLAGYIECDIVAAIAFFTLSLGFSGFTAPGFLANLVDIAPAYAGVTYGISNTLANISGFLSPLVIGLMLSYEDSLSQWQNVFWLSAEIFCFGCLIYLIIGSGKEQSWSSREYERMEEIADDDANDQGLCTNSVDRNPGNTS